jgi:hypothetical protein
MKSSADYHYKFRNYEGKPFLVIEDLDKGNKSVTNDIENVIEDIAQKERINPVEYFIVYRDCAGSWDGYNISTKQFVPLVQRTWVDAAHTYLENVEAE